MTAPRVTTEDIESNIVGEHYFTAGEAVTSPNGTVPSDYENLSLLTFCVLVLKNGFKVTGESSCVSLENFNAELGRKYARENAVGKIWPLMGYALKERIAND